MIEPPESNADDDDDERRHDDWLTRADWSDYRPTPVTPELEN